MTAEKAQTPMDTLAIEQGRRTEAERRVCSQDGCPGDGRYQPPGRGHLPECQHDAMTWTWETVRFEDSWIDKQGDVWRFGPDGLMHTPETAPFPRAHVERKWGPLRLIPGLLPDEPMPKHRLIGSTCSCGGWSAGCGNDVPEQWRQHVNAAEAGSPPRPGSRKAES